MEKNPVLTFLQRGNYSFDEGMAVLLTFSNNGGVTNFIQRRRDKKALHMELVRLAHVPRLRPIPGREMPSFEHESTSQEAKPLERTKAPEQPEKETEEDPEEENNVVTYLDLERHKKYDPDKLPPQLKDLWLQNDADYKELQYCHAQMKLANSDAGRADWRTKVIGLRDKLKKRWKLFEEEEERISSPEPAKETDGYTPGNDRSYITNALKAKSWTDERKVNVQRRVEALINHGYPFKEETVAALKERGIAIPG